METFWQDLKYGARTLLKTPSFTVVAMLALALGIGANSAIFSVVNAVLLRPLPFDDPDRLVLINEKSQRLEGMSVSWPNYLDWHAQQQSFSDFTAFRSKNYNLTGGAEPERIGGVQTTAGFFSMLGVEPILGRTFLPEEDRPGGPLVAVLSEELWQRRLGGDTAIIGKTMQIDGQPHTVIGVMPKRIRLDESDYLYTSLGILGDKMMERGNHPGITVGGRLKPGVSFDQAKADMEAIAARLAKQYQENTGNGVRVRRFDEVIIGSAKTSLLVLLGAVGFVLLIACANVANLLLARGATRQKEIAIRAAMGASRQRLIRHLLTESVLLALAGGLLAVLIALWGTAALTNLLPPDMPRLRETRVDGLVLGFTLAISLTTGVIFGLVPALQASRADLNDLLKEGARGSSVGPARHRARSILVVSEVALALMLLVGAGLMIRSFMHIRELDAGFNPENVLTMQISLPESRYPEAPAREQFFTRLLEKVSTLPGVEVAGLITPLPMARGGWQTGYVIDGAPALPPGQQLMTDMAAVSEDYFKTMRIPLLQGRYFTPEDTGEGRKVVIVDETFAKHGWPDGDAVGKRIRLGGDKADPVEIVGIVRHVKNYGLTGDTRVQAYQPLRQVTPEAMAMVVRGHEPLGLVAAIRAQVASIDRDQPVAEVKMMEEWMASSVASQRQSMVLLGGFAALALLLAAVGIYGVISYSVTQRTHEIGIRLALGGRPADVLRMVVSQGMKLVLPGVMVGLAGALVISRVMGSLLYEISATDPATFVGIPLLLTAVSLLACYLPARRAIKVDPLVALRSE